MINKMLLTISLFNKCICFKIKIDFFILFGIVVIGIASINDIPKYHNLTSIYANLLLIDCSFVSGDLGL